MADGDGGDRLVVIPAAVKAIGTELQSSADAFTSSASRFSAAMATLRGASKGTGADEIDRLAGEWVRAHGQVVASLNKLGIGTEQAGNEYGRGAEEQNTEAVARGNEMDFKNTQV